MEEFIKAVGLTVVVIVTIIGIGLLTAWPLSLLWNGCLVPAIPGVHEVTILQQWGLNVLFGAMFKTFSSTKKD